MHPPPSPRWQPMHANAAFLFHRQPAHQPLHSFSSPSGRLRHRRRTAGLLTAAVLLFFSSSSPADNSLSLLLLFRSATRRHRIRRGSRSPRKTRAHRRSPVLLLFFLSFAPAALLLLPSLQPPHDSVFFLYIFLSFFSPRRQLCSANGRLPVPHTTTASLRALLPLLRRNTGHLPFLLLFARAGRQMTPRRASSSSSPASRSTPPLSFSQAAFTAVPAPCSAYPTA